MITNESKLVVLGAMARRLGVPTRWLRAEAEEGRLPHVKAGNTLLFVPAVVIETLVARAAQMPGQNQEGADHEF